MTTTTTATDDELDEAILAALAEGGPRLWADIRAELPPAPFWAMVAALVRLKDDGRVEVTKVDGLNYVDRSLTSAYLRARGIG